MHSEVKDLLKFIEDSPTAFHAVSESLKLLTAAGFEVLDEVADWHLKAGGKYAISRNQSSVIAFKLPELLRPSYHYQIVASHSDSPTFKVKENGEMIVKDHYLKLNTEGYGGMILHTWLDRPLSLAGRIYVRDGRCLKSRLLKIDRDLLLIPNVAIHLLRDTNNGYAFNPQIDLLPLLADKEEIGSLKEVLAKELGVKGEDIISSDLMLYPRTPSSIWGLKGAFYSSPRIDNLACAYTTLKGFIQAQANDSVQVYACFDNEEVGSGTKQGALSTFLRDVMRRINAELGYQEVNYHQALAKSFMISADNGHAVHPNHPELTDETNCSYLNEGVVLKIHAGQLYTSDATSIAVLKTIAEKASVPLQVFMNRSDKRGGSTLGNLAMQQASIDCVDIGLPQLAMHSAYETAGVEDVGYMIRLIKAFYDASIQKHPNGEVEI